MAGSSPAMTKEGWTYLTALTAGLEVDGPPVSVKHGLVHRLRQGWVRENGADQLRLGGFEGLGDRVALDQLGHLGADHMRAQQLPCLAVENRLDHPLGLAERDRLAVADKREMADFDLVSGLPRGFFGQADTGDVRAAISASRDVADIERMHIVDPGDPLDADNPFVTGLVRQPRGSDEIADRIDATLAGTQPFIDDDVGFLDDDTGVLEADAFDIAHDTDGEDDALHRHIGALPVCLDPGSDPVARLLQGLNGRGGVDLDTLLLEGFAGER